MKASFLTAVFIWVCLSLIAGESYACKTPPLPEIVSPYIQYVCIGTDVEFDGVGSCVYETGSHDPDNESPYGCGHGINTYYWHYGDETGEPYWHDDGGEPNHIYRTAGTYTVELKVKDDDNVTSDHNDTCTVYVVKVEKVVKYGDPEETGPLYVGLESGVYLEAIPYPEEASFPTGEPNWTIEDQPPDANASLYVFGSGQLAQLSNLNVPGDYIVRAKCGGDDDGDIITVTVVTVETLTWETYPDDVVADPDHGPNITLSDCPKNPGKLIFPGKKYYDDSSETEHNETEMRRKVKIKATLSATPDKDWAVFVFFKCWDVDDPCYGPGPVDEDDDDPDPNKHSIDNRGYFYFEGYEQSTLSLSESNSNVVDANFIVSYQPGDNYRITATTQMVTGHNGITHYMVENDTLPSTVERSDMLTTWRKLHLELDSMAAGQDNPVNNKNIDETWNNTPHSGESAAEINGWNIKPDEGQYEGGTLTVGGANFEIIDNIDTTIDDTVYVIGNICPYEDQSASFTDDDVCPLPRKADWSLANSKFNPAYVEVVEETGVYDPNVTFIANLSNAEDDVNDALSPFSQRVTSLSYWMVQVASCYQGVRPTDGDPDPWYHWHSDTNFKLGDDSYLFGQSPKGAEGRGYNISCIFLESIRDDAAWEAWFKSTYPAYPRAYTAEEIETTTVVHEVGWVFGCDISDGGIMGIPALDPALNFTPVSVDKIRSFIYIGIP